MGRLIENDGVRTLIHHHDVEGNVVETRSNVAQAIVERNKALRNSGSTMQGNGMRYVGSIDPVIYERWLKEDPDIARDPNKLFAKLKDPDYAAFLVVDRNKL